MVDICILEKPVKREKHKISINFFNFIFIFASLYQLCKCYIPLKSTDFGSYQDYENKNYCSRKIKRRLCKIGNKRVYKKAFAIFQLVCDRNTCRANFDDSLAEKYKEMEADKILSHIKSGTYVITLEILGKMLSSEDFAQKIKDIASSGVNELAFIIGGANGLHKKVSDIANFKLSFSKMTFTHQMMRIILAEQIYRASKINANERYHR